MRAQTAVITVATLVAITLLSYQYHSQAQLKLMLDNKKQEKLTVTSMDMNFEDLFNMWKKAHSKNYHSKQQQNYRLSVFIKNCEQIYNHNLHKNNLGYSNSFGLTSFADLTHEEYLTRLSTYPNRKHYKTKTQNSDLLNLTMQCTGTLVPPPNPPQKVDWSKIVNQNVFNQGQCGSSYAFSAIGAVQALYSRQIGKLDTLSVQQIIDCSSNYGNEGCNGGFMDQALWYMIDNGVALNRSYPLRNDTVKQLCKYTKNMRSYQFNKCAEVPSGNYLKLLAAVIQGPTSVAIDATHLQNYKTQTDFQIYDGNCDDQNINQAMLIVGFGTDSQTKKKYWKLKNSMGSEWGYKGYIYLERYQKDGPGRCGVQLVAVVPQKMT